MSSGAHWVSFWKGDDTFGRNPRPVPHPPTDERGDGLVYQLNLPPVGTDLADPHERVDPLPHGQIHDLETPPVGGVAVVPEEVPVVDEVGLDVRKWVDVRDHPGRPRD